MPRRRYRCAGIIDACLYERENATHLGSLRQAEHAVFNEKQNFANNRAISREQSHNQGNQLLLYFGHNRAQRVKTGLTIVISFDTINDQPAAAKTFQIQGICE